MGPKSGWGMWTLTDWYRDYKMIQINLKRFFFISGIFEQIFAIKICFLSKLMNEKYSLRSI